MKLLKESLINDVYISRKEVICVFEKRIFIPCEDHDIPMVLAYPDTEGVFPCMLLLHGFMSYKEGDG